MTIPAGDKQGRSSSDVTAQLEQLASDPAPFLAAFASALNEKSPGLLTGEPLGVTSTFVDNTDITETTTKAPAPASSSGSNGNFWENWDDDDHYYVIPIALGAVVLALVCCCVSLVVCRTEDTADGTPGNQIAENRNGDTLRNGGPPGAVAVQMVRPSVGPGENKVIVMLVAVEGVLVKKRDGTRNNNAFDFNEPLLEALGNLASDAEKTGNTIKFVLLQPEQLVRMKRSNWRRAVQNREGVDVNVFVETTTRRSSWTDPTSLVSSQWAELQYIDRVGKQKAVYESRDTRGGAKKTVYRKPAGFDDQACRPDNAIQVRLMWDGVEVESISDSPLSTTTLETDLAAPVLNYFMDTYPRDKVTACYVGSFGAFHSFKKVWDQKLSQKSEHSQSSIELRNASIDFNETSHDNILAILKNNVPPLV